MASASSTLSIDLLETETIASAIQHLFNQAEAQERVHTRYLYRESLLRYLVGAQLEVNLGNSEPTLPHQLLTHWTWDEDCSAQYTIGGTMYVVTGTPGEPLLATLRRVVALGWKPNVISRGDMIESINDMLDAAELLPLVSAMSLEMLVYSSARRQWRNTPSAAESALTELFAMYNRIVRQVGAPTNLLIEGQPITSGNRVEPIEYQ